LCVDEFDKPIDDSLIEKSGLVGRIERLGDKWKLYTDNPDKLVKYLAGFAQDHDLIIVAMEIRGASLEDAFVKLTEVKGHAD
jgi:ABC-2 type transport system ATP-binding protein